MITARQQQANRARAGAFAEPSGLRTIPPGRGHEMHRLTETGPDGTGADARQTFAAARRVGQRAQAARSAGCPCPAGPGVSRGPSGVHLARYLRAGQCSAISSESLQEVIAGLAARDPLEAPLYAAQCPESGKAVVRQAQADLVPWEAHGLERREWSPLAGQPYAP